MNTTTKVNKARKQAKLVPIEVVCLPTAPAETKSKADLARGIFAEMHGQPNVARKDIIARFIAEAGLTKAGAGTYYQTMLHPKEPKAHVPTKMDQARELVKSMTGAKRKDVIAALVNSGLTHACAGTYYQKLYREV
jgi:hypothetical protein